MKSLRWSDHARKKTTAREIDEAAVEQALTNPDAIVAGKPRSQIYMRRYRDTVLQTEMLMRVVVEETEAELVVVTVYRTSKFAKYEVEK